MDISVIIPIYGVEKFIGRCAESLLSQTLKDGIEFIFVNDATLDNSIDVLQSVIVKHPERDQQIKIITHEHNKGLPAARNTGLKAARGKYIYHVDGDDFVDIELFKDLKYIIDFSDVDYIWSDWYLSYENKERYMSQPNATTVKDALTKMLLGSMKYNVWNKLVKKDLYLENGILFPEGHAMGEDMTMIRLLSKANSIYYFPKAGYHYVKTNNEAMTAMFSEISLMHVIHNVTETTSYLENMSIPNMAEKIESFKLSIKYPFLFSDNNNDYELWNQLWPESNKYITRKKGWYPWLIQNFAKYNARLILKLHYKLYSMVYRYLYH